MPEHQTEANAKLVPCWKWGVSVLLLSLAIRAVAIAPLYDQLRDDPDGYREIAENVGNTGVFGRHVTLAGREPGIVPTAFRPPLYPLLLSFIVQQGEFSRLAVAVFHVLLGALTCWLTFCQGWRLGLGGFAALAGILVAIDPLLINQASLVMTETLATALAAGTLLAIGRFIDRQSTTSAIVTGLCLAACVFCRPTFLIWAGFVVATMLWLTVRRQTRLSLVICLVASLLATLLPWTLRNYFLLGKPVLATTHGGYTLLLANNESLFEHQADVWLPDVWEPDRRFLEWNDQAIAQAMATHNEQGGQHWEVEYDRLCYQQAIAAIRQQPAAFLKASLLRTVDLWRPVPNRLAENESAKRLVLRWGTGIWYSALWLFCLIALIGLRLKMLAHPWCWAILLCVATTAVHAVFWSNIRMRAPLIPVVCLLAAYGINRVLNRFTSRNSR